MGPVDGLRTSIIGRLKKFIQFLMMDFLVSGESTDLAAI